ncbi:MAG: TfoX/Sxy family protein [Ignavibacteriales bacterium]|nr:TfoX/Sxy family protein [Ignavibacteriales bacterium]
MAYNEKFANRIREYLMQFHHIEEKQMMGGIVFMYNEKMCVGVVKDDMMCRIDPEKYASALEQHGCRAMVFGTRTLKGYVLIDESGMRSKEDFAYWIGLALEYNPKANRAKKKKKD